MKRIFSRRSTKRISVNPLMPQYILDNQDVSERWMEGRKRSCLHQKKQRMEGTAFRTWRNPEFNYRFDGIVYAVFVSLGFAAIENVMYVMQYGLGVALTRAFLAVPAHFGFAVCMGTFYGRAKVCDVRRNGHMRRINLGLAYLLPVSMHAFYDATAMLNSDLSTNLFLAFVVICYVLIYRRIKREAWEDTLIV